MKTIIVLFLIALISRPACADSKEILLNNNWTFRQKGETAWHSAKVPGTIYTDLLSNKLIDDPFFADNEKKVQWVDTCDWEYTLSFEVSDNQLKEDRVELVFDGLDTYASVWLNDSLILTAFNMFRTWEVECKKYLHQGKNQLLVRFEPAVKKGKTLAKELLYVLPGAERSFTRKAAYQYGWDWGPRFTGCGIWRPVKIRAWSQFRIRDVFITTTGITESMAFLKAFVTIETASTSFVHFKIAVEGQRDTFYFETKIFPGPSTTFLPFKIPDPRLWWCNGSGKPDRYRITVTVTSTTNLSDSRTIPFGIREVKLEEPEDSKGSQFYFSVNGKKIFMKGANWIPTDHFLPRVTKDRYRKLLFDAKDANMNMIRVWGGGVYEDDAFYELCDSLGILIWQDFMFANTVYPGDTAFFENVKEEVVQNVTRLRNHPCLALWCGNNEIDEGWVNWGWQKQYGYSDKDSVKIWNDYYRLFHQEIPGILKKSDPDRAYTDSSPNGGWGHDASFLSGDAHYWGVWWGKLPFDMYNWKVGRFMSEYGFQGMPDSRTVAEFTGKADLNFLSPAFKNHQKHPTGYETIEHYRQNWYRKPKDLESTVYISQLLQAEGIKTAIEAHRRNMPYCMGTLYWQLNDCWPVTSWSSVDYFGRWKALHYFVRKAYRPVLVSAVKDSGKLNVFVVNDSPDSLKAVLKLSLLDFTGKSRWEKILPVNSGGNSSVDVFGIETLKLLKIIPGSKTVLRMILHDEKLILAENDFYFAYPKNLELPEAGLTWNVRTEGRNLYELRIEGKGLAKNVQLQLPGEDAFFSDNYFDVIPGQPKLVFFNSAQTPEELKKNLKVRTLKDTY